MKAAVDPTAAAKLLGLVIGAVFVYRAFKGATEAMANATAAAGQFIDQTTASVRSAVLNAITPPPERTQASYLYSDEAYTGNDAATGRPALDGARADVDFRRMEVEEMNRGTLPPASSVEGAAFGMYPSSGRRRPKPQESL